jgi:NADH:ubiquinone oxidoreductase subunit 3 (subunit A)
MSSAHFAYNAASDTDDDDVRQSIQSGSIEMIVALVVSLLLVVAGVAVSLFIRRRRRQQKELDQESGTETFPSRDEREKGWRGPYVSGQVRLPLLHTILSRVLIILSYCRHYRTHNQLWTSLVEGAAVLPVADHHQATQNIHVDEDTGVL